MDIQQVAGRVYKTNASRYKESSGLKIELDFHKLPKSKQTHFIHLVEDTAEALIFYKDKRKSKPTLE